jgi:flagellar biosynthesis protein FlhF
MRIKKFTAPTLNEALQAMKAELGPEAIVLHTQHRTVERMFGFGKKTSVEITGAVDEMVAADEHPSSPAQEDRNGFFYTIPSVGLKKRSGGDAVPRQDAEHREAHTTHRMKQNAERDILRSNSSPDSASGRPHEIALLHQVRDDVASARSILQELQRAMERIQVSALPETLQDVFLTLCEQGVDEQFANTLVQRLRETLDGSELLQRERVEQQLLRDIAAMIAVIESTPRRAQTPRVITLVGPTGVGKTTTIMKLATMNRILAHKRVALISADTYRIGALDQLRTFAAIAQIPLEVVYEPADVAPALAQLRNFDMIFLDTVGRSQRNDEELTMLGALLEAAEPCEIHLTLTPSTNDATLYEMAQRFRHLNPDRLLFTKLDEATTYGSILNVVQRTGLPVSYLTNGQTIPDDLMVAEPTYISSLIYRRTGAYATTATE